MYVHEMIIQVQIDWFKFATFSPVKHIVCQSTLESGIEVGPTVINLAFFSRPYDLIRDYIKVI